MMHLGQIHHGRRPRFQLRELNGIALWSNTVQLNREKIGVSYYKFESSIALPPADPLLGLVGFRNDKGWLFNDLQRVSCESS